MAALQKFNSFATNLLRAKFDFDDHAFRIMLTSAAPSATDTIYSSAGEVSGSGYTPHSHALAITLTATGGVSKVTSADYTFTASGAWTPFRYGVIYSNEDTANRYLIGWFDHGASITLASGETFKADFDASNGLFTLA